MNPLSERFSQFGQAITQCSDLLVTLVNNGGEEVYFDKTPPKFSLLSNLDIVLGNVSDGYSASSLLIELSRSLARQETTKRLAPDVDDWLSQVDLRISQLNNALVENNNDGYVTRLGEIRELVLVMREGLINEMRNIEFAINTKFGNVESIHDKQSENKYLISRVSRLTDKLMLLDFKRLRSMSGENPDLLILLPNRLHDTIEQCRLSLINSLPRLKYLLWEFAKISKNTKLVWALHHHLINQSIAYTHIPSDSELQSLQLSSQHDASVLEIHPSICDDRYTDDIIDIVHSMKPRHTNVTLLPKEIALATQLNEIDPSNNIVLDTYLEDKLIEMVKLAQKEKVSCMSFWQENMDNQIYPAGFMQWAHKTLENIPNLDVQLVSDTPSEWSGNINIYDFTLEFTNGS
jgi:hypothetical protein